MPATIDPCDPPIAVPHRLEQPIERLSSRFAGVFAPETVARVVVDSHQQLADEAAVDTFLPLLAEKFAADRLRATVFKGRS
jgi:arsenate reductase